MNIYFSLIVSPFPKIDKIRKMQKILEEFGIKSTIRTEFGGDIEGACGQLAGELN